MRRKTLGCSNRVDLSSALIQLPPEAMGARITKTARCLGIWRFLCSESKSVLNQSRGSRLTVRATISFGHGK